VSDGLSGKRKPPAPNEKEKPGVGPEVKRAAPAPEAKARIKTRAHDEAPALPQRGLIVAPPVAALLAMLAMMFPTVFGGWKRWLGRLTVLATTSPLYGLHYLSANSLEGSWWGTPTALWTAMTLVTLLGSAWAWQRHVARLQTDEATTPPAKAELI